MGWSAGSELGQDLYMAVREFIPEKKRKEIANKFYDAVCDLDADDWDGMSQLEIDAEIPTSCWGCDEDFPPDQLDEYHLCKNCIEEENE